MKGHSSVLFQGFYCVHLRFQCLWILNNIRRGLAEKCKMTHFSIFLSRTRNDSWLADKTGWRPQGKSGQVLWGKHLWLCAGQRKESVADLLPCLGEVPCPLVSLGAGTSGWVAMWHWKCEGVGGLSPLCILKAQDLFSSGCAQAALSLPLLKPWGWKVEEAETLLCCWWEC